MTAMKKLLVLPCLILMGVVLLGAAPAAGVEELLRKGNEAFHNRQFQEALDYYEKAAERSSDPGLAAYNQAVAHYQLGHFRQAELHFRRTLEDAAGSRR